MTRTSVTAGLVIAGLFVLRMVQLGATDHQSIGWWAIEALRWGIIIGAVASLAYTLEKMQREIRDQKMRLATIAADATLARLQLDVLALEDYADAV